MWRQATLEQAEWLAQYEQRAAMRAKASDSQFSRMHAQYAAYRSFRIQEQAFFELAKALTMRVNHGAQNRRSGGSPRGHALLPVQPVAQATPGNIRFGATASIMVRHRYLATCPTGVGIYLAQELAQLGAEVVVEEPTGVSLKVAWVCLRGLSVESPANRVLLQLGTMQADTADSLYDAASGVDWGAHIHKRFARSGLSGRSSGVRNEQFGAQRLKDAMLINSNKRLSRPTIDLSTRCEFHAPSKGALSLAIDLSGTASSRISS